jgi:hypothetical protein
MPPQPRLYEALELTQLATPDDIKKAYRRLALKYHPDKAGPAGEEPFRRIQEAYAVLSDPKKRKVYDTHGDRGLEMLDNPMAAGFVSNFETHVLMIALAVAFLFFLSMLLLFVTFVAAKVDGTVSMNWAAVFFPVWIFDILWAAFLFYSLFVSLREWCSDAEEPDPDRGTCGERTQRLLMIVTNQVVSWLFIIFSLTLGIGLHRQWSGGTWYASCVLFLIPYCIVVGLAGFNLTPSKIKASIERDGNPAGSGIVVALLIISLVQILWPGVLCILIFVRVAGDAGFSWFVSAIPLYFVILVTIAQHAIFTYRWKMADPNVTACHVAFSLGQHLVIDVLLLTTVSLVADKLDGGTRGLGLALCPLLLLLSLLWVFAVIIVIGSCRRADAELQREEQMEELRRQAQYPNTAPNSAPAPEGNPGPDSRPRPATNLDSSQEFHPV